MTDLNRKYIIVEIIPTTRTKETGDIAQISALKIDKLNLLDRFDYRIKDEKIANPAILKIINYDKDSFIYLDTTKDILNEFYTWSENLPVLIMDNDYTKSYLQDIKNNLFPISIFLNKQYSDTFIDELIEEYNLQPTNYIVDLLYESLLLKKNSD